MADTSENRDKALLLDIVLAARDALSFVDGVSEAGFMASRLRQNAVIRSLEIVGEAAGKVSPALRAKLDGVEWNDIIGMRNRLIHDYGNVSLALVWEAVSDRLEPLISRLAPFVGEEAEDG